MSKERKEKGLVSVVVALSFIACLTTMLAMVPPAPAAPAEFIFASWNHPDEYGQGIFGVSAHENSTGSWLLHDSWDHADLVGFEWNVSVGLRFIVKLSLNATLTGAATLLEGRNYHRENITIYDRRDNLVFSQNNLTWYYEEGDGPNFTYWYYVIFEFPMLEGEAYEVLCTCEIYYLEE